MTRRFVLRPRAERDIQSVFEWYESQRPGLGDEFLVSLRERLETVRSFPKHFRSSIATYGERSYRGFPMLSSTLLSRLASLCSRLCINPATQQLGRVVGVVQANHCSARTRARSPAHAGQHNIKATSQISLLHTTSSKIAPEAII